MASEEIILNIKTDTSTSVKSINHLENAIEGLTEQLKGEDFGTSEFKRLSSELIKAQQAMKDFELSVESLDAEQKASEFGSFAGGMANITTGALAMANAMGITNESAESMINTIASGFAIADTFRGGLEGIISAQKLLKNTTIAQTAATEGATIAQKILNAVMKANPIGLLIAGITTLIGVLAAFSLMNNKARTSQELLNEARASAIESSAKEITALEELSAVINDSTISRDNQVTAVEDLQEAYPGLLQNLDAEKATTQELNEAIDLYIKLTETQATIDALREIKTQNIVDIKKEELAVQNASNISTTDYITAAIGFGNVVSNANKRSVETINLKKQENEQINAQLNGLTGVVNKLKEEAGITKDQLEDKKKADEAAKKADDKAKKAAEERKKNSEDLLKRTREQILLNEEIGKSEIELLGIQLERDKKELDSIFDKSNKTKEDYQNLQDAKLAADEEYFAKINELIFKSIEDEEKARAEAEEKRQADAQSRIEQLNKEIEESFATSTEGIIEIEAEKFSIIDKIRIKLREDFDNDLKKFKENIADGISEMSSGLSSGLSSIQTLSDAIFDSQSQNLEKGSAEEERVAKNKFETNKKLQIAQALIQAPQAILAAYSSGAAIPLIGAVMGPLYAGLAAATTIAQINKIKNSKFEGGGSVSAPSTGSIPSASSAGAGASPLDTTLFGTAGAFNAVGGGAPGSGGAQSSQTPIKAVVIGSEVTNDQQTANAYKQAFTLTI